MDREAVRHQLSLRRESLQKRLNRVRSDRRRAAGPLSQDFADQAVQRENDETLDFLDRQTRAEIEGIEKALARVDDENFGICRRCGASISWRRLDLVPTTTFCSLCAVDNGADAVESG